MGCRTVGGAWGFPQSRAAGRRQTSLCLFFFLFFPSVIHWKSKLWWVKLLKPTVCGNIEGILNYGKSRILIRLEPIQAPASSHYSVSQSVVLGHPPQNYARSSIKFRFLGPHLDPLDEPEGKGLGLCTLTHLPHLSGFTKVLKMLVG